MSARVVLVLAVLVAAGPGAAAGVLRQTPRPAGLVLRRADLGAGYTERGAPVDNTAAARGAPREFAARLARWGRIGGYEVDFKRRASLATLQDGPLEITSSASLYRSKSGAQAAFAYSRRQLVPSGYVPLPLGVVLGDEARQWVSSGVGGMLEYIVIWRQGEIDASVAISGRVGVVSAADIAPLALKQEVRIHAALGRGRTGSRLP